MKIRAGKRYVTRDGRVTGPMVDDTPEGWSAAVPPLDPWEAPIRLFRRNGKHVSRPALDLIAEHKEPQP